jgi:hypothetical protein
MNRAPTIVLMPEGSRELRFPMLWSEHAFSHGRTSMPGFVPDYDKLDSILPFISEQIHSALYEVGEVRGTVEYADDHAAVSIPWRVDGDFF